MCGQDQSFTSELKSHYIGYLYQLMLDLKQCYILYPPYPKAHIGDSSYSEDDVQYPQCLIEAEHKVYRSMANN